MIVRRFLLWARMASVSERADGASALARAYLYSNLAPEDHSDAEAALTALLDDPSPLVRRAIADALGSALDAPRHIIVALANDQSDVSSIVLARSPVISDADLIDCAAIGDDLAQTAVAIRPGLSAGVSAALAEIGGADALIALADNRSADIADFSFLRMVERHGDDGRLREALSMRRDLPIGARQALAVAVAQTLSRFTVGQGWLTSERSERVTREAKERATVSLTAHDIEEARDLVAHLRESSQLTPALILRALLSGATTFVEAAFAELSDMPLSRVAGLLADPRGAGFAAVYRKTGLSAPLAPAFRAAFEALRRRGFNAGHHDQPRLSRAVVEHVIAACDSLPVEEAGRLVAMLRRFESEAAREDARERTDRMADQAALETLMEIDPEGLLLHDDAVNDDNPSDMEYENDETVAALEEAFANEADARRSGRLMVA